MSINRYSYVVNNAVNFVDVNGTCAAVDDEDYDREIRPGKIIHNKHKGNKTAKGANAGTTNGSSNTANTTRNLLITTFRNLSNSGKVQKSIEEADEIYKDLKGVSSGAPKFVKVLGMTVISVYSDINTLTASKSLFKRSVALDSLSSNLMPPPYNTISDIISSIN